MVSYHSSGGLSPAYRRSQVSLCEICCGQSGIGTGFSPVLRFSPINIIPPKLHTHLHLHAAITRTINERGLGTFQKSCSFVKRGRRDRKILTVWCTKWSLFETPTGPQDGQSWGQETSLFSRIPKPSLWPHPVPGFFFRRVKWQRREANHSPPC